MSIVLTGVGVDVEIDVGVGAEDEEEGEEWVEDEEPRRWSLEAEVVVVIGAP